MFSLAVVLPIRRHCGCKHFICDYLHKRLELAFSGCVCITWMTDRGSWVNNVSYIATTHTHIQHLSYRIHHAFPLLLRLSCSLIVSFYKLLFLEKHGKLFLKLFLQCCLSFHGLSTFGMKLNHWFLYSNKLNWIIGWCIMHGGLQI